MHCTSIRDELALTAERDSGGCNDGYGCGLVKVKDAYNLLPLQEGCAICLYNRKAAISIFLSYSKFCEQ
jgi:hypothetical protein